MRLRFPCFPFVLLGILAGPCLASEPVVLQLKWHHAFQFAGYYMAQARGFYQEAGLDVTIREGRPGIDFVEEVVSDRAQYGTGSSGVVLDRNRERPVVVLAVIFQHSPDVLMVTAKSGINSPQQLAFKTVMADDSTPAIAAMLLDEVGSLSKFTLLDQTNDLQGLIDGKLDAVAGYSTDQPFFFKERGIPVALLRPINYGVDFYGDNLFTSERELRGHPERARAFREASLKGWEYAMAHPEETIAVIQKKYGGPNSAAHLRHEYEAMRELLLPDLIEMGHINAGRWRHIADTYVRLGLLSPDYSLNGFLYQPSLLADHERLKRHVVIALGVAGLAVAVMLGLLAFNRRLQREIKVRQRAEAALQERENRLRTIIDNEPECIKLLDREGRLLDMNPAGLAMIEADSLAQVRGQQACAMVEGRDRGAFLNMVEAVFRGEARQLTFEAVGLKGGRRLLESIAVPLREGAGQGAVYALLGVTRDVTERKRIESELDRYRHHLEELVDERTRQLIETNRALEATRDQAEAANRAKSVFLANMSHEIRSPMNAIVGFTHLLRRQISDPRELEYLRKISDSTKHLLAIVNDILDISKIEAGKLALNEGAFDLAGLFEGVHSLVSERAERKNLRLITEIDPGLTGLFRGDALRLGQVLLNFAGNAVKFTQQGSIIMRVEPIESTRQEAWLRFEVRDTGIGIAPEDQGRLFEAFEQVDGSTTRQYGGTGLGLTISRRLVELMGGDIGMDSQPGQGSVFWFTVRLTKCPEAAGAPATPARGSNGGPPPVSEAERAVARQHRGGRILLAEDSPINREMALDLLRAAGLEVDVAENGAEAVERARRARYDLILMDVQMPTLDGLGATRAIRALPDHQATPILAMTANVFEEDRRRCLEAGMDDHIGKPMDPERLFEALLKWLPARPATSAAATRSETPPPSADWPNWLDTIPGLDPAKGVKCLNGNVDSYLRLLRRFADSHGGAAAGLRGHLGAGDFNSAKRLAHTLKGVAGSLGAVRVQSLAVELDGLLGQRGDGPRIAALAGDLDNELGGLVAAILAHAGGEPAEPPPATDEILRIDEIFARLDSLLGQSDLEAATAFRESAPQLRAALGERATELGRLIDEFEYERALALLRKATGA